jgi:hypothetical protein
VCEDAFVGQSFETKELKPGETVTTTIQPDATVTVSQTNPAPVTTVTTEAQPVQTSIDHLAGTPEK